MNQVFYIFILFALLFIIESKAINILLAFVGLMITLAIQLTNNKNLLEINGEYFSYILILVQVSALTILFGFIIMLFPKLSLLKQNSIFNLSERLPPFVDLNEDIRSPTGPSSRPRSLETMDSIKWNNLNRERIDKPRDGSSNFIKNLRFKFLLYFILGSIFISATSVILLKDSALSLHIKSLQDSLIHSLNSFSSTSEWADLITTGDTKLLRKLGVNLYAEDNNIIKLILLTTILLLAIIILFFLVSTH